MPKQACLKQIQKREPKIEDRIRDLVPVHLSRGSVFPGDRVCLWYIINATLSKWHTRKEPSYGIFSEPWNISGKKYIFRQILWDEESEEGFECIIQCSWILSFVLNMLCFIPKSSASPSRHWNSSVSLMAPFKLGFFFIFYFFHSGTSLISLSPLTKPSKPGKKLLEKKKEKHL